MMRTITTAIIAILLGGAVTLLYAVISIFTFAAGCFMHAEGNTPAYCFTLPVWGLVLWVGLSLFFAFVLFRPRKN